MGYRRTTSDPGSCRRSPWNSRRSHGTLGSRSATDFLACGDVQVSNTDVLIWMAMDLVGSSTAVGNPNRLRDDEIRQACVAAIAECDSSFVVPFHEVHWSMHLYRCPESLVSIYYRQGPSEVTRKLLCTAVNAAIDIHKSLGALWAR